MSRQFDNTEFSEVEEDVEINDVVDVDADDIEITTADIDREIEEAEYRDMFKYDDEN